MQYRSFFINLKNKSCFVIGGNKSAAQISSSLMADGALVTVWSEDFAEDFLTLGKKYPKQLNLLQAEFTLEVATHYCSARVKPFIVITVLADPEINQAICDICISNNVLSANPAALESEVIIADNYSADPVEIAVIAKGYPVLTKYLQEKFGKYMDKTWLESVKAYSDYANSEEAGQLSLPEKRIFFRRLAEEIIKSEGDFEQALQVTKAYYENLQAQDDLLIELAGERYLMD
ncbi:MAG: NAD(P)-dependent oxidoreductase [Saccharofermentanales bacterium]|jgi:siroheme synthase (precorrin-2 oxidase/ferrochelatase)